MLTKALAHVRRQWMGALALFLVLSGGTAIALDGHNTVFSDDIVNGQVKRSDLAPPEAWHEVAAGSEAGDACADGSTAVFCSTVIGFVPYRWQNFGSPHATAGFYIDQLGIVHLKGLIKRNLTENGGPRVYHVFRLPAAYRPDHRRTFAVLGEGRQGLEVVQGRVDVGSDGFVDFETDCNGDNTFCSADGYEYLSLDGVSFRPDE